jgi:hypothetical protein
MARKGYPFSKRSEKQMTNLISSILAGLIAAPLSGVGSDNNTKTSLKEVTIWVIIGAVISNYFLFQILFDPLMEGAPFIVYCIPVILIILSWVCVFFQVRKYERSEDKKDKL